MLFEEKLWSYLLNISSKTNSQPRLMPFLAPGGRTNPNLPPNIPPRYFDCPTNHRQNRKNRRMDLPATIGLLEAQIDVISTPHSRVKSSICTVQSLGLTLSVKARSNQAHREISWLGKYFSEIAQVVAFLEQSRQGDLKEQKGKKYHSLHCDVPIQWLWKGHLYLSWVSPEALALSWLQLVNRLSPWRGTM